MKQEMQYSLLDDSIIEVQLTNGEVYKTNLPDIFCQLLDDRITSFEALQPHQQQPWYSFLVQLGAMAIARENNGEIPTDPQRWRELLIGLADGSQAAWHLVVEDVSQPAFMQPPVPEGSLEEAGYSQNYQTPDDLDMLITSKNHSVKKQRISRPALEHWLFALITLQTMEGYSGGGGKNRGIVRMSSGYGNRPMVGITKDLSWGNRFLRDTTVLIKGLEKSDSSSQQTHCLLWLDPWDGSSENAIQLFNCDPYFIEICRRIRFTLDEQNVICWKKGTVEDRISTPEDFNGITGDPWVPIEKRDLKAFKLKESGFRYDVIQELLLGNEYKKPIALKFQDDENDQAYFISFGLVRGQGETHGVHRRFIPISSDALKILQDNGHNDFISGRARKRVAIASETQNKILKPAIRQLIREGQEKESSRKQTIKENEKIKPWLNRLDREIDRRFFESLWASVEMEPQEAKQQWEKILFEEAEKQFKQAERSTPIAQLRRLRAVSKARSVFYGRTKEVFEFAGPQTVSAN